MENQNATAKGQSEQSLEELIEKHKNSPLYNEMKSLHEALEKMDGIQNEMTSLQKELIGNIQKKMAAQLAEQEKSQE